MVRWRLIGAVLLVLGLWITLSPIYRGLTGFVSATFAVRLPTIPSLQFSLYTVVAGLVLASAGYILLKIKKKKSE